MARYPGMMRRGTKWYLRVKVPDDVVEAIGKREIWKSLRTGDYQTARTRFLEERTALERRFSAAREGAPASLTEADARRLVVEWFQQHDHQSAEADFNLHGHEFEDALDAAQIDEAMVVRGAGEEIMADVQSCADLILMRNGWPTRRHENPPPIETKVVHQCVEVDRSSPGYAALCTFVRRGLVESARRSVARMRGHGAGRSFDPMFAAASVEGPGLVGRPERSTSLADLVRQFLADPTRDSGSKANHDYQVVLRLLGEFVDTGTPASAVTRDHCRSVAGLLKRMPANASKKAQFRGLGPLEAAAKAERLGVPPMKASTANSLIGKMSALFRWATTEGIVDRNPAERLLLPETTHKRDARSPFSTEQLNAILSADVYREPRKDWDHRQWVFLLALFGGLRMNEACTLRCDDVQQRSGVQVLSIAADQEGVKKLKTRASQRVVPVHPTLDEVGFRDFVERQRRAGHATLFPLLKPDRRGYYSDAYQKWFSRQLAAVGAAAPRTTFHSTRHNFRDALREAGVGRDAVLALGGWSAGGTEEVYGGGLKPGTLARELAKVRYPGLVLRS